MKLYTGIGDKGQTVLFDGTRVSKDDARVAAYGTVDELNAVIGWCRAAAGPGDIPDLPERLQRIQEELFVIGAELATPAESASLSGIPGIDEAARRRLEEWIDAAVARTMPLKYFILPGGSELASRLHIARTCCRRAEREVVHLAKAVTLHAEVIIYINRLGDLLFAWARLANHEANLPDVVWRSGRTQS